MGMSEEAVIQPQDRRRCERIEDDVLLFWREVKPEEIPEGEADDTFPVEDFTLASQIKLLSLETAALLKRIERADPALAEYLATLERKVDTLADAVLGKDNFRHCHSTRHLNLSASGLAFLTEQEYHLGTLLELRMVFSNKTASIAAYGRVIYCIHYDDDKPLSYRIGVGFIRLQDADRERLAGHVSDRQTQHKEMRATH